MRRFQKFSLPLWGSLTAAVLLAGGITLLALWCQPQRSALCALRLPGPAAADCAQRPAGGPCAAGFCLFIPKCVLRRGNHEFSRVRPCPSPTDQDRGSGRAGFSPGLCSSQRGGAGHEQLHHLLPSGGHRGSGGHHGAAGDSGRFHRRTALPPGAAAGLAGAASGMLPPVSQCWRG